MTFFPQYVSVFLGLFLNLSLRALCDLVSDVSITSVSPYREQRFCAQACLWGEDNHTLDVGRFLQCPPPVANACWCSEGLASSASSFLTSCVNRLCSSASGDVIRAVSVYNGYCNNAAPAINEAISTTNDNNAPTSTVRAFVTVVSSSTFTSGATSQALTPTPTSSQLQAGGTLSTETSSTPSSTAKGTASSSGGLDQQSKIGIGLGIGLGIPTLVFAILTYLKRQKIAIFFHNHSLISSKDIELHQF